MRVDDERRVRKAIKLDGCLDLFHLFPAECCLARTMLCTSRGEGSIGAQGAERAREVVGVIK